MIEQMRDGMLVIDAQMRIAELNGAAQELLVIKSKGNWPRGRPRPPLTSVVEAVEKVLET